MKKKLDYVNEIKQKCKPPTAMKPPPKQIC